MPPRRIQSGLAVIITNDDCSGISLSRLITVLQQANFAVQIFQNENNIKQLGEKILQEVRFPQFMDYKKMARERKKHNTATTIPFHQRMEYRKGIYNAIWSSPKKTILKMLSNMTMYEPNNTEKGRKSIESRPCLFVIYLGTRSRDNHLLHKVKDGFDVILRYYLIEQFQQDFIHIPDSVYQVFTFITMKTTEKTTPFHYYVNKPVSKQYNVIDIELKINENNRQEPFESILKIICRLVNKRKNIRDIEYYLNKPYINFVDVNVGSYIFQRKW